MLDKISGGKTVLLEAQFSPQGMGMEGRKEGEKNKGQRISILDGSSTDVQALTCSALYSIVLTPPQPVSQAGLSGLSPTAAATALAPL